MLVKGLALSICVFICSFQTFSQRTETALNMTSYKNRIYFGVENDMLFQTDSYYTAGLSLSWTNKNLKKSPAQLILKSKNG